MANPAKIKVQARHLQKGDRVGTGEVVIWAGQRARTPRGKVEVHLEKAGYARLAVWGASTTINVKRDAAPVMQPHRQVGPRDMIRADGSYDWQVIKTLARRRASAEVDKVERWIAQGRLSADCRTSLKTEFRAAINFYYRDMAKISWALHPANVERVQMATIVPFGKERAGLRLSAY